MPLGPLIQFVSKIAVAQTFFACREIVRNKFLRRDTRYIEAGVCPAVRQEIPVADARARHKMPRD
jgi:hypothetical protein